MSTKREITDKAKALIDTNANEALELYREAWQNHQDEFNDWDAFFTLKTARKVNEGDLEFIKEIIEAHSESEKVQNLTGWFVFDKYIKGQSRVQLTNNEYNIERLLEFISQKNLREDNSFPCPFTISVLSMVDAHGENLFNARKIEHWLSKLNPEYLSKVPNSFEHEERGHIETASDLEKYFANRSKALLKLTEYESCKEVAQKGLSEIDVFHTNNDLWFKMRIALCEEHLGNLEKSEELFKQLLHSKAGHD